VWRIFSGRTSWAKAAPAGHFAGSRTGEARGCRLRTGSTGSYAEKGCSWQIRWPRPRNSMAKGSWPVNLPAEGRGRFGWQSLISCSCW
jgi:hypothetical protein